MVFRLCLCVALLFVCGYANNSSEYCRVLLNYDKFSTSLDQFLASLNETGGVTDMGGENKTACLAAVDRRVIDLENKVEKLLNDNKNKVARISYLERTLENKTADLAAMDRRVIDMENNVEKLLNDNNNKVARISYLERTLENKTADLAAMDRRVIDMENNVEKLLNDNNNKVARISYLERTLENKTADLAAMDRRVIDMENNVEKLLNDNNNKVARISYLERTLENKTADLAAMDRRVIDMENNVEKLLNDNNNKVARISYLERTLANLTSERSADCGPPPQQHNTDVYISSGFQTIATYTCKTGFMTVYLGQQATGLCQKDGNWSKVNLKCFNLSSCWSAPNGKALYAGTVSNTKTGKVCQRWDSDDPNGHNHDEDAEFSIPGFVPQQSVTGSANYCRDPDAGGYLWCYTTDPDDRWGRCDVPEC
ncbi:uncharacterized protein LOC124279186 isoform X2 [Haliotis rubra]|uniref:uncharacterized protein LOC124279186 isoform X2 n=1 Tax=Haliotis rubra TaxID=36100 RepID=UPI001EE5F446|nr:uncharacterized protein LOC124279186 isoform X2 [Haliotis rubra]